MVTREAMGKAAPLTPAINKTSVTMGASWGWLIAGGFANGYRTQILGLFTAL